MLGLGVCVNVPVKTCDWPAGSDASVNCVLKPPFVVSVTTMSNSVPNPLFVTVTSNVYVSRPLVGSKVTVGQSLVMSILQVLNVPSAKSFSVAVCDWDERVSAMNDEKHSPWPA